MKKVVSEQFRAVGLAVRTEAYFFVGALILLGAVVIASAVRQMHIHPSGFHTGFTYGVSGAIPIFCLSLLIPFGVWRTEDPSRRAYHWTMPVARGPHTIIKLLSAWAWLMIASVVYLGFIILLATILSTITGEPNHVASSPGWEWIVSFTAPTLGYLLISVAVIGSDHAWRWIIGVVLGYWIVIGVLNAFGIPDVALALQKIWAGTYGLKAALFATVPDTGHFGRDMAMRSSSLGNWLVAMPLWIIGSAIAATFVSYRHRE
jgi:hypothetical protein